MKLKTSLSIISASLLAAASVFGQASTKPVGFQTVTLKASSFNLVGINFLKAPLVVGVLDSLTATTITDAGVDFSAALTGQSNLVVEVTSGTGSGLWANVSSFSTNQLTVDTDLTASVSTGASYQVFSLPTIAEVFGATNSAGLKDGNSTTADIIWLSKGDGSGGFDKYYYAAAAPPFVTAGWKNTSTGNANASGSAIYHHEAMIIERRGTTDLPVTFTGTVKTSPTTIPLFTGFNWIDRAYPSLATLSNSGLSTYLLAGNSTTADIVWMANATGGYDKYYFAVAAPPFVTAGWKKVGSGNTDAGATSLESGIIIERRGGNTNLKITPDAAYSNL